MIKIRGRIISETDKAIQIKILEDDQSKLKDQIKWFPKSQIRLDEEEIGILIPQWMHDSNVID